MGAGTLLELTHNPFVPPRNGFYPGGDRKTHFDHIRHLSQWSRRVLLVTGPFGIGKSTLFGELTNNLESGSKAARLSGASSSSQREVLAAIAQGFGVAMAQDMHADDAQALLVRHVEDSLAQERLCMVMVDDAHLLNTEAVDTLIALTARCALRLVLFAETAVVGAVSRACKRSDVEWFEIRLGGFEKAEVADYLAWRFAQAGHQGPVPFSNAQLEKIADRSGGNPHVIDMMANELLTDLESGGGRARRQGFPRQHAVLVGLLVAVVALAYGLLREPAMPPETAAAQAREPAREPGAQPVLTPSQTAQVRQEIANESAVPIAGEETGRQPPVTMEPLALLSPESGPAAAAEETQETQETQESRESRESREAQDTVTAPSSELHGTSARAREPAAAVLEEVTAPAIPVLESTATPDPQVDDTADSAGWFAGRNPARFTLQIHTLSSEERAQRWISEQSDPGGFGVIPLSRNGRQLFVIAYGEFDSRVAAQAAATRLALDKPWIRTIGDLKASTGN